MVLGWSEALDELRECVSAGIDGESTGAVVDVGGEETVTATGEDWCPCGKLTWSHTGALDDL